MHFLIAARISVNKVFAMYNSDRVITTEYTELQPLLSGVHSVMRVKSVLAGEGGGCAPTPLSLHLPSPVKLQCTLQLSGKIHWPCFISTNTVYVLCGKNIPEIKKITQPLQSAKVQRRNPGKRYTFIDRNRAERWTIFLKYLVANATLFGYLFFNSYIGKVLRLMRNRFYIQHFACGFVGWRWAWMH